MAAWIRCTFWPGGAEHVQGWARSRHYQEIETTAKNVVQLRNQVYIKSAVTAISALGLGMTEMLSPEHFLYELSTLICVASTVNSLQGLLDRVDLLISQLARVGN